MKLAEFLELSQLVRAFNDAALDSSLWPKALEVAAHSTGSEGALFAPEQQSRVETHLTENMRPVLASYFAEGWYTRDIRLKAVPLSQRLGVITDFDCASPEMIDRDPYWQEWLASHGLRWFAGVALQFGDVFWGLSLQRTPEQGPVLLSEVNALRDVRSHLCAAAAHSHALSSARIEGALAAFEVSHRPVLLLNREGVVVRANPIAERLLGIDLQITCGRLTSWDPKVNRALEASINGCIEHLGRGTSAIVALPRKSGRALVAYIARPNAPLYDAIGGCQCAITLVDPEAAATAHENWLQHLFGLSAAESRLALQLGRGVALPDLCRRLGISHETGRTQVKSIYARLGLHSQAELAHLLTSVAERSPSQADHAQSGRVAKGPVGSLSSHSPRHRIG